MTRTPSPLERSSASGLKLLAGLLALLALVLGGAAVLVLTIDESPNPVGRGMLLAGLATGVALLAGALLWWSRRSGRASSAVAPTGRVPPEGWRRLRLGPAWTDWLALLFAPLVGAAIVALRTAPMDGDAWSAVLLVVGVLELIVLPAWILGRRELVTLRLVPGGVVAERRDGARVALGRGDLREVRLVTRHVRGFALWTLELHRATGATLVFREPMSAPLDEIARLTASHLGLPLA
ncbi:MAG: hypothetical protein IT379_15455 [Deltaproteobacteria bacterium]|nr:hypothetical protein [Deltaproteobacteria bacterium]